MFSSLKAKLNHRLARVDAGEMVKAAQPLRKYVTAPVGLGIGAIALGYNLYNAHNGEARRKTLIRDGLVITGIGLASVVASRLVHIKHLPHKWTHKIIKRWNHIVDINKLSPKHKLHGHHHHGPIKEFTDSIHDATTRIKSLFGSTMHSHGIEGSLNLSILSALPIFAGGVPFGTVADAINGEDWGKTLGIKIKEGLFQFVGNITMCTVAILAFSNGSLALTKRLWKNAPKFKQAMIKSTEKRLNKLIKLGKNDLQKVPGQLTQVIEHTLLKQGKNKTEIYAEIVGNLMPKTYAGQHHSWEKSLKAIWIKDYEPRLKAALNSEKIDKKAVRQVVQEFYSDHLNQDIATVLVKNTDGTLLNPEMLEKIAESRTYARGEIAGVVPGVAAGVFGGALVSNGLNNVLTNVFNLPESHSVSGFFKPHDHPSHSNRSKKSIEDNALNRKDDGWLAGKLGGPRGLHWFDWMLHLDDAPSAFYLMGVEALESVIQVLYGISGFIAGTAGTDYSQPSKHKRIPTAKEWLAQQHHQQHHLWEMSYQAYPITDRYKQRPRQKA